MCTPLVSHGIAACNAICIPQAYHAKTARVLRNAMRVPYICNAFSYHDRPFGEHSSQFEHYAEVA